MISVLFSRLLSWWRGPVETWYVLVDGVVVGNQETEETARSFARWLKGVNPECVMTICNGQRFRPRLCEIQVVVRVETETNRISVGSRWSNPRWIGGELSISEGDGP